MNDNSHDIIIHESNGTCNEEMELGHDNMLWSLALESMKEQPNDQKDVIGQGQDTQKMIASEGTELLPPTTQYQIKADGTCDFTNYLASSWKELGDKKGYKHLQSGLEFHVSKQTETKPELSKILCETVIVHTALGRGSARNPQKSLLRAIHKEVTVKQTDEMLLFEKIQQNIDCNAQITNIESRNVLEMPDPKNSNSKPQQIDTDVNKESDRPSKRRKYSEDSQNITCTKNHDAFGNREKEGDPLPDKPISMNDKQTLKDLRKSSVEDETPRIKEITIDINAQKNTNSQPEKSSQHMNRSMNGKTGQENPPLEIDMEEEEETPRATSQRLEKQQTVSEKPKPKSFCLNGRRVIKKPKHTLNKQKVNTTTFSQKTRVMSTSAISGLLDSQGTMLKRLWPDSSIFIKKILKWIPPEVIKLENGLVNFKGPVRSSATTASTTQIPDTFRDTAEMVQKFTPHLLEEGKMFIDHEFKEYSGYDGVWKRETLRMQLVSCIPIDAKSVNSASGLKTYEFAFTFSRKADPPQSLGELFVIHCDEWLSKKTCLGVKGSNDYNAIFLKDQQYGEDFSLFKVWVCVASSHHEETGWLAQSDLPQRKSDGSVVPQTMYLLNLGTVAPIVREFEGIKAVSNLKRHLKNAIFCSKTTPIDPVEKNDTGKDDSIGGEQDLLASKNTKPSSIPAPVWANLTKSLNPYQLNGIRKCITGKAKENFLLLQGPPGTGKTATIVGLVSSLLQSPCPAPNGKVGGTRIRVGESGSDMKTNSVRFRILVCAPSNIAVDDLAWRIHTSSIGPNGSKGGFKIIRFGACAGEHRHDGRKRNKVCSGNSAREKFLRRINLDLGIENNASERDLDFDDRGHPFSNNRRDRHINYSRERRARLDNCHVVCTTLSSAGSKAFIEAVSRNDSGSSNNSSSEFDAVIIDEACQASEAASLIPLKFNPTCVVLVGDPNQLPVTVLSESANRGNYGRSLFQRLQDNGWPVDMLRMQYRMHEEIVSFPSRQFYQNRLVTSPLVLQHQPAPWYSHRCFPPFLVWNCNTLMEKTGNGALLNQGEVEMVLQILGEFQNQFRNDIGQIDIGIIAFYSHQVAVLQNAVNKRYHKSSARIQVSTVDGFQGSEKDIIILSCTRSYTRGSRGSKNPGIGFLVDSRRLNVALTRARKSLWIVGNCQVLSHGPVWEELLDDAAKRYLIADTKAFRQLCEPRDNNGNVSNNNNNNNNNARKDNRKRPRLT